MLILRLTLISVSVNLTLNLFWERSNISSSFFSMVALATILMLQKFFGILSTYSYIVGTKASTGISDDFKKGKDGLGLTMGLNSEMLYSACVVVLVLRL